MLAKTAFIVIALAVSASTASGQQKSYSFSKGPSEMCGITGGSAADFRRQVSKSKKHKRTKKTDLFEVFVSEEDRAQWVFTLPSEPAHPAVTCRQVIFRGGALYLDRQLVCGASRKECDRLAAEFEAVDEQARQAISK